MRILVVVPSVLHKTTAGSRIRYDRLNMSNGAFEVAVQSISELDLEQIDSCDVVIFSKTYTTAAIAMTREMQRRGKVVGIDLFDDYFSTLDDARLTRFRAWLGRFAKFFDFALCSTTTMRRTVTSLSPSLTTLMVPDVYPQINRQQLSDKLIAKRQRALESKVLDVVWFGIGSNPFFPVGLHDLAAFAWSLNSLRGEAFEPRLTIVTDDAALQTNRLARLQRLAIAHRIETWSLEAEATALDTALVAFIPVNGQSFSRAKSLNRALTAISAGAQVLSPGYPLYDDLGAAIYRDGAEIIQDLPENRLRIRPKTIDDVVLRSDELSSLSKIAADLYVFLASQVRARTATHVGIWAREKINQRPDRQQALIISQDADRDLTAISQRAGILAVRGPFTQLERIFDIRLEFRNSYHLDVWVRPQYTIHLDQSLRERCSKPQKVGKTTMVRVDTGELGILKHPLSSTAGENRIVFQESANFEAALCDIERVCHRLFPEVQFLTSDIRAYMRPDLDRTQII